uniref:Uncharacterized protein n=1 Tax=viral metagenome TaxID=1070528 RepID=A0A6C0HGG8_9ZZZZ
MKNKKSCRKKTKRCIKPSRSRKTNRKTCRKTSRKFLKKGGGTKITIATNSFNRLLLVAHLDTPEGFAFEYSSGKSNIGQNFPNTFLPIKHVQADCYIKKSGDLYKNILYNNESFDDKLKEFTIGCPTAAGMKHLEYFINRFGVWKELQISAALGGGRDTKSVWDIRGFPYVQKLRDFALNNDYDYDTKTFIPRRETIDLFNWKEERYIPFGKDYDSNCDFRAINGWLTDNGCKITYESDLIGPIVVLNRSNFNYYKTMLRNTSYKLTDILKADFKIKLPKTLDQVPEENDVKKELNEMVVKITTNIPAVRAKITMDLKEVEQSSSPDLLKYMPFLKFQIVRGPALGPNTEYEVDGEMGSHKTILSALLKAQELYPSYTTSNPFEWDYC